MIEATIYDYEHDLREHTCPASRRAITAEAQVIFLVNLFAEFAFAAKTGAMIDPDALDKAIALNGDWLGTLCAASGIEVSKHLVMKYREKLR